MERKLKQGLLVAGLLLAMAGAAAALQQQGTFDRTLNVTGAVDLTVTTGAGHIVVKPGGSNAVVVHGTVRVNDRWDGSSDAQARVQRIVQNPPIEQNGNFIHIGRIDDPELNRNVSISYDVTVPTETRLTAKTGSGEQSIDGIRGPVESATGSGELKITNIGGEVRASTGSGGIQVNGTKGEVHATTGSGRISARGIGGAFDGQTGSGGIDLEQTAPGNVNVGTGSGNIVLKNVKGALRVGTGSGDVEAQGTMDGDWRVETASGSVRLELPSNAGFELVARSASGSINVDRQITTQGTLNRHEVRGTVNGGGHTLELHTASGAITVR